MISIEFLFLKTIYSFRHTCEIMIARGEDFLDALAKGLELLFLDWDQGRGGIVSHYIIYY